MAVIMYVILLCIIASLVAFIVADKTAYAKPCIDPNTHVCFKKDAVTDKISNIAMQYSTWDATADSYLAQQNSVSPATINTFCSDLLSGQTQVQNWTQANGQIALQDLQNTTLNKLAQARTALQCPAPTSIVTHAESGEESGEL